MSWKKPFDSWEADFLHTPNHPQTKVFFDILLTALRAVGLNTTLSAPELAQLRSTSQDYLADNIIWPIYPEIATRRGIQSPRTKWRAATTAGEPPFGLEEMLTRSFARFEQTPNLPQLVKTALAANINQF